MVKLFDMPIYVNKSATDRTVLDVGANLFVGGLDPDVDEKVLYDTFTAFGVLVGQTKVMRDPDTGNSKGFGFVAYDCFEASDAAIDAMHGQFLMNRPLVVQYAYKKDTKNERHGTPAERLLAAQRRLQSGNGGTALPRPHTNFSAGPKESGPAAPPPGAAPAQGRYTPAAPPAPYPHFGGMVPPPPPPRFAGGVYPPQLHGGYIPPPPISVGFPGGLPPPPPPPQAMLGYAAPPGHMMMPPPPPPTTTSQAPMPPPNMMGGVPMLPTPPPK